MGKKKMDIMLAEREKFVNGFHGEEKGKQIDIPGCVANGISAETANHIYDKMVSFAAYAFNKSHAAAYAAISMETAYLKCHYPLEFACGLLTSVMDKPEKLAVYADEFRKKGVKILPPDVNTGDVSFTPSEDGGVRYGLQAVKGAGKDAVTLVIKERDQNGKYTSYIDFLRRNRNVGSKVCEAFIYAGALDSLGTNRRTMEMNLKHLLDGFKKENKGVTDGQMNLFDFIDPDSEDAKTIEPDVTYYEEYPESEKLNLEKAATGAYISGFPLDRYSVRLGRWSVQNLASFVQDEETGEYGIADGVPIKIAAVISRVHVVYTKAKKEPMAFLTLEDRISSIDCVVFPKIYAEFSSILEEDKPVVIYGTTNLGDKGMGMKAERIISLENPPKDLWLKFETVDEFRRSEIHRNRIKSIAKGNSVSIMSFIVEGHQFCCDPFCISSGEKAFELAKGLFKPENIGLNDMVFCDIPGCNDRDGADENLEKL